MARNVQNRRILVSAYGCEPGKGSEQGVGWNWTLQLSRLAELVVLTRSNNQEAIEAALTPELRKRVRFEFYDPPRLVSRFKRKEKGLYFYYLLWQWGAYRRACQLVKQQAFDYVLHLTFGSIWMPTFMYRLPVPFIWGPVGGGEAVPAALLRVLPLRARLPQILRYLLMGSVRLNPLFMAPLRRACAVLARTEDTARLIPAPHDRKVKVVLETSVSEDLLEQPVSPQVAAGADGRRLRVMYSGRLVALKNVSAAMHAVARARSSGADVYLTMVGSGPERQRLEQLARDLGIQTSVEFLGNVTQAQVMDELRRSDAYLFPSLKEGGVWSLMEAMSVGLPVVCVRTSGMTVITDEESAIRVAPISQEHMIAGFAEALVKLAASPERRREIGDSARRRIEQHFRWEHKGDFLRSLFDELEKAAS